MSEDQSAPLPLNNGHEGEHSGWVRVEDRLPENIRDVLVWTPNFYAVAWFHERWMIYGPPSPPSSHVTHWMELPAPPIVAPAHPHSQVTK